MRTPVAHLVLSVFFVGAPDAIVDAFHADLPRVKIYRAAHAIAARERIPVTRPLVVIVPPDLAGAEKDDLLDVCVAVGAEVVSLGEREDVRVAVRRITEAMLTNVARATVD